ncbi:MAG: hypothetical protein K2H17_08690 [Duncaniella sp.]|uniref:hypothetical protein n=1 Tax=Duncaniella sp. TaxID=2518496 RepID=UPI0023CC08BC|nr:hypothetical protein [Duncaniella sp.]MDE5989461.1 hypothetical protein [Duncaniella sp.]
MKKLLSYFSAICLSLLILTACGGPSWNQERAQELCSKEFESLTPQDFDDMLDLMEAYCFNSDIPKSGSEEWDKLTEEQRDEQRASFHIFMKLSGRVKSMATASKRIVSDSQVEAHEAFVKRVKEKMMESNKK